MSIYRKHIFTYVPGLFRIFIIGVVLFGLLWLNALQIGIKTMMGNSPKAIDPDVINLTSLALAAVFAVLLVLEIYRLLVNYSTYVRIDESAVVFHSGILPWNTSHYYWKPFQIFSAAYDQHGFLRWLLSYGSVAITGREGSTKEFLIPGLWRPKQCSIEINSVITD